MQIRDKVILITGGSEGIGAACARLFHSRGAKLSLVALPGSDFTPLAHTGAMTLAGDIADPEVRRRAVRQTLERFGRIDVLLNNAGVGLYWQPSSVPLDLSRRLFEINVWAPLELAQLVIPHMKERGSGMLVQIGSIGGAVALPWAATYCASKFTLHAYSDALRRELRGTGIHVLKVCPGIVGTGFRSHVLSGEAPGAVTEVRRVVSPEEVASAVLRGIEREAHTVHVPFLARIFMAMEFFSPALMDWYVRRKNA